MRLCGCNPNIDYTPVAWAMRTWPSDGPPRVRETAEAETTVTAFEGLGSDLQAQLLFLKALCWYRFTAQMWTVQFDWKGTRHQICWEPNPDYTLQQMLAYYLDHGYAPELHMEYLRRQS